MTNWKENQLHPFGQTNPSCTPVPNNSTCVKLKKKCPQMDVYCFNFAGKYDFQHKIKKNNIYMKKTLILKDSTKNMSI